MKLVVYLAPRNCKWFGRTWDYAKRNKFSLNRYIPVYVEDYKVADDIIDKELDCLAHIHQLINYTPPMDYNERKLTFGDVLEINGIKYYIDYMGLHKCEE